MKIKARLLRYLHCLYYAHKAVTERNAYYFFGFTINLKRTYIGCNCGKSWYGELSEEGKKVLAK